MSSKRTVLLVLVWAMAIGCSGNGNGGLPGGGADMAAAAAGDASVPDLGMARPADALVADLAVCGDGGPINYGYDPSNCGRCGVRCCILCSQGRCIGECAAGLVVCAGPDAGCSGNYICHDLSHDDQNCGACYHACPQGHICVNGTCT